MTERPYGLDKIQYVEFPSEGESPRRAVGGGSCFRRDLDLQAGSGNFVRQIPPMDRIKVLLLVYDAERDAVISPDEEGTD